MPPTLITLKALLFSLSLLALPPAPLLAQTDGKAAQPVSVTVAEVSQQRLPSLIEITGTLQAAQRAAIAAKITGVITQIPVELGSAVKAGDLLVTISAEEIAARLDQAEARLAQARRNLEREQNLLRKNAATPETVKSMHDQANIAQAGYREARAMLDATTITAPFDGVVTRKKARSGDLATPGAILLHLENNRTLQVTSAVPESLMLRIRPGDVLTVKVEAAGVVSRGRSRRLPGNRSDFANRPGGARSARQPRSAQRPIRPCPPARYGLANAHGAEQRPCPFRTDGQGLCG
jgi:membrane fusion protein, multidrug efflux system